MKVKNSANCSFSNYLLTRGFNRGGGRERNRKKEHLHFQLVDTGDSALQMTAIIGI